MPEATHADRHLPVFLLSRWPGRLTRRRRPETFDRGFPGTRSGFRPSRHSNRAAARGGAEVDVAEHPGREVVFEGQASKNLLVVKEL
jgi:hypothetical protein